MAGQGLTHLSLGGSTIDTTVPMEAPWSSFFGACSKLEQLDLSNVKFYPASNWPGRLAGLDKLHRLAVLDMCDFGT